MNVNVNVNEKFQSFVEKMNATEDEDADEKFQVLICGCKFLWKRIYSLMTMEKWISATENVDVDVVADSNTATVDVDENVNVRNKMCLCPI